MTTATTSRVTYKQSIGRMQRRSNYQVMQERIALLAMAERSCIREGSLCMAFLWRNHRRALENKLAAMPISYAELEVMSEQPKPVELF